jgi:transposase
MAVHRQRRYSVEFKLQLVRAYLSGEGSLKGIAGQHGLNHSLLLYWIKKFQAGELTDDDHLADQIHEYEAQISALERKVGQLTMELDVLKKGLRAVAPTTSGPLSLISGPSASASRKDADS